MRDHLFEVTFTSGRKMRRYALSAERAMILTQAEMIKNGEDYTVESVAKIQECS